MYPLVPTFYLFLPNREVPYRLQSFTDQGPYAKAVFYYIDWDSETMHSDPDFEQGGRAAFGALYPAGAPFPSSFYVDAAVITGLTLEPHKWLCTMYFTVTLLQGKSFYAASQVAKLRARLSPELLQWRV